jgi:hypothetical protein
MGSETKAKDFFANYNAENFPRFSDPKKILYQTFGLETGSLTQVLGAKSFIRGLSAFKYGIGTPVGDVWQMPGVFLIHKGEILKSFVHETISDLPDYQEIVCEIG